MSHQRPMTFLKATAFCLLSGAAFGVVSAVTLCLHAGMANEAIVSIPVSALFGMFVGALCAPIVASLFRKRAPSPLFGWMLLIVGAAVIALSFLGPNPGKRYLDGPLDLPTLMFCSAIVFVATALILSRIFPKLEDDPTSCTSCGYDLRGSVESARCPECGEPFDPADLDGQG